MKYTLVSLLLIALMVCRGYIGNKGCNSDKGDTLVYCNYTDPKLGPSRYKEEFHHLMLAKRITVQEFSFYTCSWTSDIRTPYCKCMDEKINERYGKTFIDQMKATADSLFFTKHINDTLEWSQCDDCAHYPGDIELYKALQSRFDTMVKYPKGYHKDPNAMSYIDVDIVVNKKGEATITALSKYNCHPVDYRFKKYLEDQFTHMLPKSGWKPATLLNHPVNFTISASVSFNAALP